MDKRANGQPPMILLITQTAAFVNFSIFRRNNGHVYFLKINHLKLKYLKSFNLIPIKLILFFKKIPYLITPATTWN